MKCVFVVLDVNDMVMTTGDEPGVWWWKRLEMGVCGVNKNWGRRFFLLL